MMRALATSPFSLRLTDTERALLCQRAGRRPLGEYIRSVLFGEKANPRAIMRRLQGKALVKGPRQNAA